MATGMVNGLRVMPVSLDCRSVPANRQCGVRQASRLSMSADARRKASHAFESGKAFKVITGLNNFDRTLVSDVVKAADVGGATHIDIACDPSLVLLATSLTHLPICVSSVEPAKFVAAVEAGAHMVEIGNFDCFYESGREFSATEVMSLTRETRSLLPSIYLSVTVPHTLPLDEQVSLAHQLVECGADVIQTEGGTSSSPAAPGIQGLIQKAVPSLSVTFALSASRLPVPIMCSSGISHATAKMAFAAGASAIGVGSAINRLNDPVAMLAATRSISDEINAVTFKQAALVREQQ